MHLFNMKSWVASIVVNVFIFSIISLILPEGKTSKTIKTALSTLLILVVLQPFLNLNLQKIDFDSFFESEYAVQTSYLDFVNEKSVTIYEKNCEEIIEKYGISEYKVNIIYDVNDNNEILFKKIQINLKNSVINSDESNINIIAGIKTAIQNYLSVSEGQIEIYE